MIDEFTLATFGPTEFKTLLVLFAAVLSALCLTRPELASQVALVGLGTLIVVGLVQLPVQLYRAVKEVNQSGSAPDTSEWVTRQQ